MTITQQLQQEIQWLPEDIGKEVLDFVRFLKSGKTWAESSHDAISAGNRPPCGAAKGFVTIPDSFFEPLPDDLLTAYNGQKTNETAA